MASKVHGEYPRLGTGDGKGKALAADAKFQGNPTGNVAKISYVACVLRESRNWDI